MNMKKEDKVMLQRRRDLFWSHGLAYVSLSLPHGRGGTGKAGNT